MDLYTAKEPKCEKLYEITRRIHTIPAKNILLWVLHCLYQPPTGKTIVEQLVNLASESGFLEKEKKNLKLIKIKGLKLISEFDVALLFKIIKQTCLKRKSQKQGKNSMKIIKKNLEYIVMTRHRFAHDDRAISNYNKENFIKMIYNFIERAETLIIESGKLSGKSSEESENKLKEIKNDIAKRCSVKIQSCVPENTIDLEASSSSDIDILNISQEKPQDLNNILIPEIVAREKDDDEMSIEFSDDEIIEEIRKVQISCTT